MKTLELIKTSKTVSQKTVDVDGTSIFYREAGDPNAETILMLHGFPSSSHMYRNIIDGLADRYHIVAPDYPGFGLSDAPSIQDFEYTFDNLSHIVEGFIKKLDLTTFYLLVQDYGGPVGMRIAAANPQWIKGLIVQNSNAYLEGLGEWPQQMNEYANNNEIEKIQELQNYFLSAEGIKYLYTFGANDTSKIDPISYLTDTAFIDREGMREIQLALSSDYGNNIPKYQEWQEYFRNHQPKTLVLWGIHDKFFSKAGGEAYKKDLKNVETHFFDGGHFMLEEYKDEAIALIKNFLNDNKND